MPASSTMATGSPNPMPGMAWPTSCSARGAARLSTYVKSHHSAFTVSTMGITMTRPAMNLLRIVRDRLRWAVMRGLSHPVRPRRARQFTTLTAGSRPCRVTVHSPGNTQRLCDSPHGRRRARRLPAKKSLIRHDRALRRDRGTRDADARTSRESRESSGEEVVMKNVLLKGLGAMSVIGMLAAATAAQATDVRAQIPFTFSISKQTLPPGTYTVSTEGTSTLFVRGSSGGALSLTSALQDNKQTGAKLVFHRYGDRYVLREVWSDSHGRKPAQPAIERELIARNGVASMQVVEVAIPTL